VTSTLPATGLADIGAYVGVPLTLRSGRVYGALCVTSHDARSEISAPDVAFMRLLSHLVSEELSIMEGRALQRRMQRDSLAGYLAPGGLRVMLQPIVNITNGRAVGVEALARFPGYTGSPSEMFSCAAAAGIGVALELAAITAALGLLEHVPDDVYLAVNASPDAVADPRLQELLARAPGERLVLELTEHVAFTDHAQLMTQLAGLRRRGVRIAVDDTGSGFASLQNVLAIAPDVIKLDLALVTGIDRDPVRRALARALTAFAAECGATLVAEGIETRGELETLRALGVTLGQGYYLSRPALAADLKLDTPAFAAS
jgi:EAL domain-containing protein (putative c-di-GMP-specific phosphodiesterase class I)